MYFLLEMGIFHCYVSLPETNTQKETNTWRSQHFLRLRLHGDFKTANFFLREMEVHGPRVKELWVHQTGHV